MKTVKTFEPRCKVCTSPYRDVYEKLYLESEGKISWRELERRAKSFGEQISWKAFQRHFEERKHFSIELAKLEEEEDEIKEIIEKEKKEAIDILAEIKNNLQGLKSLLSTITNMNPQSLSPAMARTLVEIYREHRQTLEACERLTTKLSQRTGMTRDEFIKMVCYIAQDFCKEDRIKLQKKLKELLGEKVAKS
ncbi:hypothetical protein DRN75_02130 [Nanoarchaeota archaeon]|nr:MAG: hypothetical protein DRN75_02130 [Nanoarchaeota archaeon]